MHPTSITHQTYTFYFLPVNLDIQLTVSSCSNLCAIYHILSNRWSHLTIFSKPNLHRSGGNCLALRNVQLKLIQQIKYVTGQGASLHLGQNLITKNSTNCIKMKADFFIIQKFEKISAWGQINTISQSISPNLPHLPYTETLCFKCILFSFGRKLSKVHSYMHVYANQSKCVYD